MPGSKIRARGRNGYFRVAEINTSIPMDKYAQISLYSSRYGERPPVIISGPLENMLKLLDKTREALTSTKEGDYKTIKLSSECGPWGE